MTKKEKARCDMLLDQMVKSFKEDCSSRIEIATCPRHIGYIFQKIAEIESGGFLDGKFEAFYCKTCLNQHSKDGKYEHYIHLQLVFNGEALDKAFLVSLG
jgi:hypothetical protein